MGVKRRALLASAAVALLVEGRPLRAIAAGAWGIPWTRVPGVTVLSTPGDSRLPLVNDAVAYWNRIFTELGSAFRLGSVSMAAGMIAAAELKTLSDAILGQGATPMPPLLQNLAGQMVVALSDGEFISFASRWPAQSTALVAIKSDRYPPLTLPNVARNVIAHEMGHAIGLGHNGDPAMLMCGRPASCRPDAFASPTPRYFPLTTTEKAELLRMYPANWRPQ